MSKPLFEFVKVAAGEPSNLPQNVYTVFRQPDIHAASDCLLLGGKIISYEKDQFILRPAESTDAGREGFIEKVIDRAIDMGVRLSYDWKELADFMRSHWPETAEPNQ